MENKTIYLKRIGANIKTIRKKKYVEAKEAAAGLNITVQALGAIENGKVDVNVSRLFEIAQFFNVEFAEILDMQNGTAADDPVNGRHYPIKITPGNSGSENIEECLVRDILLIKRRLSCLEETLKKSK